MANTYVSCYVHYIFSTKERRNLITAELQPRLWAFMGGIARENQMKALAIGGIMNHSHLLLSMPGTISIAKAAQLIKGGSSKWVHDTFPNQWLFGWQEGYGSFSVSVSQLGKIVEYINRQEEHHRKRSFEEEYLVLLKKHRIDYDERYVWD